MVSHAQRGATIYVFCYRYSYDLRFKAWHSQFHASFSEGDIRIRFNTLCGQFENNSKYIGSLDQKISEKEDISIQMGLYNKRYEAHYFQLLPDGQIDDDGYNRVVWFMIDEEYGRYRILMFYDNVYNQANGDDL